MASIRIIASPAFNTRDANPYNWLLYAQFGALGVHVDEFSLQRLLRNRYSIWHLHWPEHCLQSQSSRLAWFQAQTLLFMMHLARIRGVKLIWTVHNLSSRDRLYPQLETKFWKAFTGRLDGFLSLSQIGIEMARARFPALSNMPGFVVPHGHYRSAYLNDIDRASARALIGIPPSAKVALLFGQIGRYKNSLQLIRTFRSHPDPDAILLVVGHVKPPELAEAIKTESAGDNRIRLYLSRVPNDEVQIYFRSADLVTLPYRDVRVNSGSSFLALSFDRPVLLPTQGPFSELQTQVGPEWVRLYTGPIDSGILGEGLKWAVQSRKGQPHLDEFDWQALAQKTLDAYSITIARSRPHNVALSLLPPIFASKQERSFR